MRIVVTSDSHKSVGNLFEIVEKHLENADLFINLGDGESDVDTVLMLYPNINIERVCGNCDWNTMQPLYKTITVNGKRVFFTHGHIFHVKTDENEIKARARQEKADVCLFGHTHNPLSRYEDGIYYLNPGSVRDGSYGIVDITDKGILAYNLKI